MTLFPVQFVAPQITINGEATVELDFAGCAIRMLYHERGIDYRDDPYELELISTYEEERGLERGHFRDAIKKITQALINDRNGRSPERISLERGVSFHPRYTRLEVRQMIEEKHFPIADTFGTGVGLRLQRDDSDLALVIITEAMKQNEVVLPIHDSFITTKRWGSYLRDLMIEKYSNRYIFDPIIKIL